MHEIITDTLTRPSSMMTMMGDAITEDAEEVVADATMDIQDAVAMAVEVAIEVEEGIPQNACQLSWAEVVGRSTE